MALDEALANEGMGNGSATAARKERDAKQHALEAAQAGEAALRAQHEATVRAESEARLNDLREQMAGIAKRLEAHPVLQAVVTLADTMRDFEALDAEARAIAGTSRDAAERVGAKPLQYNRRGVAASGETWRLVSLVEHNVRTDQPSVSVEVH
jgi:hypothetical protein